MKTAIIILLAAVFAALTANAVIFTIKLVDCLEKCLICRHIRRFAD